MANIKKLKENGQDIFPITHEQAVLDSNGVTLDTKLNDINNNIPTKTSDLANDSGYLTSIEDNLVTTNISDGTLTLTTDKYQSTTMENNTTIVLPTVDNYTEIHLFFTTTSDISIIMPNIKFEETPNIISGKTYHFIFTYIGSTVGWIVKYIQYE